MNSIAIWNSLLHFGTLCNKIFFSCHFADSQRKHIKALCKSLKKALYFIFRHHRSRQQQPQGGASGSTAGSTGSAAGSAARPTGIPGASTEEPGLPPGPPQPPVTRRRRRRSITKENASPARSPLVQAKISTAHDADGEDNDGKFLVFWPRDLFLWS